MPITKSQLKQWLAHPAPLADLRAQIREAAATPIMLDMIRQGAPRVRGYAPLTYTLYREFERTGERDTYQDPYFMRRGMLTRALIEFILGDASMRDPLHDLLWAICEETTWVLPAHEEQGPNFWEIRPRYVRTEPLGAHTMLTREPDSIDLFCAETGAALAEAIYLVGDDLAPEVRQRVIQEVQRRIFRPYLAYARAHWWFKGDLNWNGVCNGSIGLAFLRLERDPETLAEALALVLEGFEAYIATGFEADGGSVEGVGYWNYGLMYYVTVAELLRELTGGQLDLLATPRMKQIAYYPVGMALTPPLYLNFGDSTEVHGLALGMTQRLAERTNTPELRALLVGDLDAHSYPVAKLPITIRSFVWWDGKPTTPPAPTDFYLPDCRVIRFVGQTGKGKPVILGITAGHNDGHHSHTDIASFVYHLNGESLVPDAGRGKYTKQYFRRERYQNIFNNSYSHNVPRIDGQLQQAGPEFGGHAHHYGTIVEQGQRDEQKVAVIDFHTAYEVPSLTMARRTLSLDPANGQLRLEDEFTFDGEALPVEEAFVTWGEVEVMLGGERVRIRGQREGVELYAPGAVWRVESLEAACRENGREGILKRITTDLSGAASGTKFVMHIQPLEN